MLKLYGLRTSNIFNGIDNQFSWLYDVRVELEFGNGVVVCLYGLG